MGNRPHARGSEIRRKKRKRSEDSSRVEGLHDRHHVKRKKKTTRVTKATDASELEARVNGNSIEFSAESSEILRKPQSDFRDAQKERLLQVKAKRRMKFEEDRNSADSQMRTNPAEFLWKQYLQWAGERLTPIEAKAEHWTDSQVGMFLLSNDDGPGSVIKCVKDVVHDPYARNSLCSEDLPSVSVILVASSGLRASNLGKACFDGKPVGKLFSKHFKKSEQTTWLQKHGFPVAAPTAVGTARRIHVLCDERSMSLSACSVFVIDMKRDEKLRNILDMPSTRDELFDLIHVHLRPLIKSGKTRVLLCLAALSPPS